MEHSLPIILHSPGTSALRSLIALRRANEPKFSYSFISRSLGIKARSYLSEVLKGIKKLNERHIEPIVDLLDLPVDEADLLKKKLLLEMGDLNPKECERLRVAIKTLERKFSSKQLQLQDIKDINIVMVLGASLFLFTDYRANRRQFLELFPKERYQDIETGLGELLRNGLFIKDGEQYTFSEEFQNVLHLYTSTARLHEINYLKASLQEALLHVNDFDRDSQSSIFYSGIVTSEMAEFCKAREAIRQNLRGIQSQIVTDGKSDTLIRFNVQLYPIVHKKKD